MSKDTPLRPGSSAPVSGIYDMLGKRGGFVKEVVAEKGEPLPPTPGPGMSYVLDRPTRNKSGKP
jgi:hypothetical protein